MRLQVKLFKKPLLILAILALFYITSPIWLSLSPTHLWLPIPFKVTDPDNERFNSSKFRFEDYSSPKNIEEALGLIFQPGVDKKELNQFFVGLMGLEERKSPFKEGNFYSVYYFEPIKRKGGLITGRYVAAKFDLDHKLQESISFSYMDTKRAGTPIMVIEENEDAAKSEHKKIKID